MLANSSMRHRRGARRRIGAFGALCMGLLLSVACGGNADSSPPSPAGQGSISRTCARSIECRPERLQAECEENMARMRVSATTAGCTALYDQFLSCDEQHPGICESDRTYEFTPECIRAADAAEACMLEKCSMSTGACPNPPCPNSCDINCTDFGAQCSGWPGEPMTCVCTKGSRAGSQFTSVDCGVLLEAAPDTCR